MKLKLNLGYCPQISQPLYWANGANNHLYISGKSGYRKTTLLRSLAVQLPAQEVRVIVLDFAGDFSDDTIRHPASWPPPGTQVLSVYSPEVPISSMQPWPLPSGGQETANQFADRIAGVLQNALRLGPKQWAYLYGILKEDFECSGFSSMRYLLDRIEEDAPTNAVAVSLQSRMAALNDFPETVKERCYEAFQKPGVTVIDGQDIRSATLRNLVTEIVLGNLYAYKLSHQEAPDVVVLLDECQHLRFDGMAQCILREGRKYGLAGWFSSQSMDKPAAVKALGQAALQIFFHPDDDSLEQTAKRLTQGRPRARDACKRELMQLRPGQFICLKNGCPVKVDGNIFTEMEA